MTTRAVPAPTETRWTMTIPGWAPTFDNRLKCHPMVAHRRKKRDADVVATAALVFGVPKATGKRRLAVTIRGRYGRFPDDFAPFKSLLDALVRAGLLVDDARQWCEVVFPPTFERAMAKETVLVLEDI